MQSGLLRSSPRRAGLRRPALLGFAGALVIASTTPAWRLSGRSWRVTLPGLPHDGSRPLTAVIFFCALAALSAGWIGLVRWAQSSARPERQRVWIVAGIALLWFVPVLLGPPLLSTDVYSYAAQGDMLSKGLDPASEPMSKLHYGSLAHVDTVWRNTNGNPYGPIQFGVSELVHDVTPTSDASAIAFRLLSVAGLLLSIWGICDLARRHGVSPPVAVAIGIANPIAVVHIVGGGHNDGLLMALLLTGFALVMRGRFHVGVIVLALGAAVKLPGAAPTVFLAWNRDAGASILRRIRNSASALAVTAAVIVAAGTFIGVKTGWISAIQNVGIVKGTWSLPTHVGYLVVSTLEGLGFRADPDTIVGATRFLGLVAAALVCLLLLRSCQRQQIALPAAVGLAMATVVLLGPVVWPWYLGAPIALIGTTDLGRWRSAFVIVCVTMAGELYPVGIDAKPVFESNHLAATVCLIGLAAVCVGLALRTRTDKTQLSLVAERVQ